MWSEVLEGSDSYLNKFWFILSGEPKYSLTWDSIPLRRSDKGPNVFLNFHVSTCVCVSVFVCVCICVRAYVFVCTYMYDSCSDVSDFLQPHGLKPTRLLWPWNSPGKRTGLGCHFLLQGIFLTQVSYIAGRFFTIGVCVCRRSVVSDSLWLRGL